MRVVRSATWTSGEPVSDSCVRYCLTMSALPDSNSVTFTQPPKRLYSSLFFYKPADYHRSRRRQTGSIRQYDPRPDEAHAAVANGADLSQGQHVVGRAEQRDPVALGGVHTPCRNRL